QQLRDSGERGLLLVRGIVLTCILSFTMRALAPQLHIPVREFFAFSWHEQPPRSFGRAAIEKQLNAIPGKHLVIVRYKDKHEPFAEWVYNNADIANARIVWAREMGPTADQALIRGLSDRTVWRLDADETPPKLFADSGQGNKMLVDFKGRQLALLDRGVKH